jgi:integrase
VLSLLHNAAFRRAEVVAIRVEDLGLDGDKPSVVTTGKGRREPERIIIDRASKERIERLLQHRGRAPGFLLLSTRNTDAQQGLTGEAVRLLLQRRAKALGLGVIRPHGLRHTAATVCLRNGSIDHTKALGRWRSLSAPARYIDADDATRQRAMELVML